MLDRDKLFVFLLLTLEPFSGVRLDPRGPYEHWGPNGPQKTGNISNFGNGSRVKLLVESPVVTS